MRKKKPIKAFAPYISECRILDVMRISGNSSVVRKVMSKDYEKSWELLKEDGWRVVPVWISMEPPHE